MKNLILFVILSSTVCTCLWGQSLFEPADIFELEYASDPQISPNGSRIAYIRQSMDIMKDRGKGRLWQISYDGSDHRPILTETDSERQPRWSPSGDRLLYVGSSAGHTNLYILWMDTGRSMQISNLAAFSLQFELVSRWEMDSLYGFCRDSLQLLYQHAQET